MSKSRQPSKLRSDRPLRVLLFGDYSNYTPAMADALQQCGCEVTTASEGCFFMDTDRDINIRRRLPGKLGGIDLYARLHTTLAPRLSGFDVVGLNNPSALTLRPRRVRAVIDMLRRRNGSMFLMGTGYDPYVIEELTDPSSAIRYTEWHNADGSPAPLAMEHPDFYGWLAPELKELARYVYARADGMTTALYEYWIAGQRVLDADKVGYAGIPVDVDKVTPTGLDETPRKVRIFLGRHSSRLLEKGTDLLETAARRVVEAHPDKAELVIVEDRPYSEYLQLLDSAHIVLDQVYSYTPATNALLAMARGKTVLSGAEEDFYDFIGEKELRPIINALPDVNQLQNAMTDLVLHPESLRSRGLESREFVERHNSPRVVATRVLSHWQRCLCGT
ncbi:MAG: hypothetical protein NC187_01925 [Candidatus Amulumruptor caecigallinarius]|nr:hypothetical protein [Candidatus Amulumruptor caecigallinarius]MCM1396235.1 hypothetical protein [Candidatus Amulumruptor caecigallinarius]MCM1453765.1 hypothetical protein [bacterium]